MSHITHRHRGSATVLVVDPRPVSLTALAAVIDSQGYECYCARNAKAACKAVEQRPIDMILWDVADDAAAAIDQIHALRELHPEPLADVPVILIAESCWAGLETRLDPISPARCLFKPLDPNTLIDLIQQSLWVPHVIRGHHLNVKKPLQPGWVKL
ncbi:transcriptional regulatory protein ZraR [Rosistilla carotiformis]|uniref:Transcriptional regulatory protein ZraR n=1 Tax=Rosistilla carotiformis TaxID=2528017 RepID=A0A518JX23_9BACT|nr:response regulator [Rosistilla carotiformis]QDV70088.1 transcriptional regulatory protein ZraR [Rosistilla carotiformis]